VIYWISSWLSEQVVELVTEREKLGVWASQTVSKRLGELWSY
jgi:hypothetical protein